MQTADVVVIGGGIVGLASAYQLRQRCPRLQVFVLEKENEVAAHQTGRNSGVIHAGLYYRPGSLRARLCVEGRRELVGFAREHHLPHDVCGKIVVAVTASELPFLEKIHANGLANGLRGLERIGPERIREIEPHCRGVAGLWVPETGIIDFAAVARALAREIKKRCGEQAVLTGHEAHKFVPEENGVTILTNRGPIRARGLIACAGLQSDRVARLDGVKPRLRIVPFRGDYYELTAAAQAKIRNLVYPVPHPAFPFLGVHFTRRIGGGVECGPNAVFSFKREGYGKMAFSLFDTAEALGYPGTWRLFARHWRYGLAEYRRAFSRRRFVKELQRLAPAVTLADIKPGRCGVRAQALGLGGELLDDFCIEASDRAIHVLNAPSPAATAALAIGRHIADLAAKRFGL